MKRIISIVNPRPGAGKTGLAVNMAACLALFEKRTLVVDADPRADAAARLLPAGKSGRPGLDAVLTDRVPATDAAADTVLDYLKVIPAGSGLSRVEQELLSAAGNAGLLSGKIAAAASGYDYVLIDSPSSPGALTVSVLAASEAVLIPLPCQPDAAASLASLLPVVARVKKQWRPDLTIAGIVLTRCDGWGEARAKLSEQMLRDIETIVLDTVIPESGEAGETRPQEPPAVMRNVMSAVSEKYLELTAELLGR